MKKVIRFLLGLVLDVIVAYILALLFTAFANDILNEAWVVKDVFVGIMVLFTGIYILHTIVKPNRGNDYDIPYWR